MSLRDLGMNAFQDLRRVLALEHVDYALYGVGIIVFAQDALTLLMGVSEPPEVADENGYSLALGDHDVAQVRKVAHQPDAPYDIALLTAGNTASPGIRAVVVDRRWSRPARPTPRRVSSPGSSSSWYCMVKPPKLSTFHHAGHLFEGRDDYPRWISESSMRFFRFRLQGVAVDLTGRSRERVEAGLDTGGKIDLTQAVQDALSREVIFGTVLEYEGDEG